MEGLWEQIGASSVVAWDVLIHQANIDGLFYLVISVFMTTLAAALASVARRFSVHEERVVIALLGLCCLAVSGLALWRAITCFENPEYYVIQEATRMLGL